MDMIRNWKWIAAAVLVLAGVGIGSVASWQIRGVGIHRQKATIERLGAELEIAQQVSRENTETIARLRAELQRSDTLCSARLKNRDRVVARIREIDAIKTEGKDHEKGPADPLLDRLNGMFGPDGR